MADGDDDVLVLRCARMINLGGLIGTFGMSGVVGLMTSNGAFETATLPMGMVSTDGGGL